MQSDVVPDLGLQVLLGAVGGPKWASNDIRYPLDLGLISRERERERQRFYSDLFLDSVLVKRTSHLRM